MSAISQSFGSVFAAQKNDITDRIYGNTKDDIASLSA
jgi:hypothetical protein